MKDNNTIEKESLEEFEAKNHKMLAEKWLDKNNKISSYREFVKTIYDAYNHLNN